MSEIIHEWTDEFDDRGIILGPYPFGFRAETANGRTLGQVQRMALATHELARLARENRELREAGQGMAGVLEAYTEDEPLDAASKALEKWDAALKEPR